MVQSVPLENHASTSTPSVASATAGEGPSHGHRTTPAGPPAILNRRRLVDVLEDIDKDTDTVSTDSDFD